MPARRGSWVVVAVCGTVAGLVLLRSLLLLLLALFSHERSHMRAALSGTDAPAARETAVMFVHASSAAVAFALPPVQLVISPRSRSHPWLGGLYVLTIAVSMPTAAVLAMGRDDTPWGFALIALGVLGCVAAGLVRLWQWRLSEHAQWMRWSHQLLMLGFGAVQTADQIHIWSWSTGREPLPG